MRTLQRLALTAAIAAGLAGGTQAAPFTNGSFETTSPVVPPTGFTILGGGSTRITGWVVTGTSIDIVASDFFAASDGNFSLDLAGTPGPGGIQQTFDTISGNQYQVTFDLSKNPGATVGNLNVQATGGALQGYVFNTPNSAGSMNYSSKTYLFTASGTSTTLSFIGLNVGNTGAVIDNVRLADLGPGTPNAVPAPAGLVLLGLGVPALGLVRRRKLA